MNYDVKDQEDVVEHQDSRRIARRLRVRRQPRHRASILEPLGVDAVGGEEDPGKGAASLDEVRERLIDFIEFQRALRNGVPFGCAAVRTSSWSVEELVEVMGFTASRNSTQNGRKPLDGDDRLDPNWYFGGGR